MPSASSAVAVAALAATAPSLSFDQAFPIASAPRASHAVVLYRAAGGLHRLELWRDGERRVRRDTDKRLTSIAFHRPGAVGYRLTLLDHPRRLRTDIDRDSLARVGQFADWEDFAHGLRRPLGPAKIEPAPAPRIPVAPIGPCRWFRITAGTSASSICWSKAEGLPLVIVGPNGTQAWRIVAIDHAEPADALFVLPSRGYVLNDAAADISGD